MIITGENRTGIQRCVVGAEAKIHIKVRPPPRDNASVSSSARRYLRKRCNGTRARFIPRFCFCSTSNFGRSAARIWWKTLTVSSFPLDERLLVFEIIVTFLHDIAYRRTLLPKLSRVLSRYTSCTLGSIARNVYINSPRSLVMQDRIFYSWQLMLVSCIIRDMLYLIQ